MNHVKQADALFKKVKEPQEAILDSRILLLASNASAQKVRSLKSGTGSFDVDEFVAKLATFMGGQKQVRQENFPQEAGSDVEEEDMHDYPLDWAKIGRKAMAKSRRAPAMSFMLGPLSLEQKKRANMKREKHEKNTAEEVKPQELKEEDIQRSENETTKNVHDLEELLGKHCTMEDESIEPVNLFKFILNPHSFAQSVENVFYLSFLIRDGRVALETNEHGEPVIYPCEAPSDADYAEGLKKNQLVLEFDMQVWKVRGSYSLIHLRRC
ncbi:Smc5-6 complex non-SMC subunit Nse4 [Coprinopsis cinerea okayama7|uniref:Non-structural maintenance of chromosomes element 4 n=1 Tax=Coprinopsis cinerea (strain Okayama-7 / 130 / ATCC MYA-4618 / FGSC 9003) TaxID=240176 RepID=A8N5Y0_COPC7|nr:Smc5-6 complex non-SMC subunit Nse4 [Coprinopsis cinerea okayama7\|eukprot:XP_001830275.2 Smc5-6 complex non-SMC subunit Nse4 [Coprinopsis cinerea okayama7\